MDKYLATIYGGALMGIGVGCVFRTGASTGGMDIPPLIINKYTHIPLPVSYTHLTEGYHHWPYPALPYPVHKSFL